MASDVLSITDLNVYYGSSHILQGTSLSFEGGVVALVGRNGMGKTTLAKAIMGLVPVRSGAITFQGRSLVGLPPYAIARLGVGYVPQGRGLFSSLTVEEHLLLAARNARSGHWDADAVYELFPRLKERRKQSGTTLSGGEQQMLAIGRALVTNPSLLVMDEPAEGLAPVVVEELVHTCRRLVESGMSVFLIEQNLYLASAVAERAHVMVTGTIAYNGPFAELLGNRDLTEQYLGVSAQ